MAGRGRRVMFHGAFGTKAKARRKERRVKHGYIRRIKVRGHVRYAVLTRRKKR